jgi:hypothetical protein
MDENNIDNVIIPCEFCNEQILMEQYPAHLIQCFARNNFGLMEDNSQYLLDETNLNLTPVLNQNQQGENQINPGFSNMFLTFVNATDLISLGFNITNRRYGFEDNRIEDNRIENEIVGGDTVEDNDNENNGDEVENETGGSNIEIGIQRNTLRNTYVSQFIEIERRSDTIRRMVNQFWNNEGLNSNIIGNDGSSLSNFMNRINNGLVFSLSSSNVLPYLSMYRWIPDSDNDDYDFNTNLANILGKVEVGLTKDQIDQVSEIYENENLLGERCPICLEEFIIKSVTVNENIDNENIDNENIDNENIEREKENEDKKDTNKRRLKCGHIFCDVCIITWLNKHKKCPYCQIDLEDKFLIKN